MPKVLIVEDDDAMSTALRDGFSYEGYTVLLARDGATGLKLALEGSPDVVILDVMLPKMSGLDVCKRLRGERNSVPILMLSARGQEIDKVLGLRTGADDYITKPFSFMELMARVEAVLRRTRDETQPRGPCRIGDVEIDFRSCEARRGEQRIPLSARELRLLEFFLAHRGEVIGRDHLLKAVWGYDGTSSSRTVDVHVAKLRRKIEERPDDPRHLVTIHGLGYKLNG